MCSSESMKKNILYWLDEQSEMLETYTVWLEDEELLWGYLMD